MITHKTSNKILIKYNSIMRCLTNVQAREIKIPQDNNSADPSKAEQQMVSAMTVSPSEETLVVVTDASQLYQITMSSAELGKVSPITSHHIFWLGKLIQCQIFQGLPF